MVRVVDRQSNGPGEFVAFSVSADDDHDPDPTVVCVPASGSFFPAGTTLVTCTATDAAGNESSGQFPVHVRFKGARESTTNP